MADTKSTKTNQAWSFTHTDKLKATVPQKQSKPGSGSVSKHDAKHAGEEVRHQTSKPSEAARTRYNETRVNLFAEQDKHLSKVNIVVQVRLMLMKKLNLSDHIT